MPDTTAPRYHTAPLTGAIHQGDPATCTNTDCTAMHALQQDADARARTALAPLEAKIREASAAKDARIRAATYREAAELVAPKSACKCSTCSALREKADLLRTKADEIHPPTT